MRSIVGKHPLDAVGIDACLITGDAHLVSLAPSGVFNQRVVPRGNGTSTSSTPSLSCAVGPVVDLELNPRRRDHVQRAGRQETFAGE